VQDGFHGTGDAVGIRTSRMGNNYAR
jgi:hypothetical protein